MEFIVSKDKKTFTIKGELAAIPTLSKSQKSLVLASTNGNQATGEVVAGEAVKFGVNIYIPANAKTSSHFSKPEPPATK